MNGIIENNQGGCNTFLRLYAALFYYMVLKKCKSIIERVRGHNQDYRNGDNVQPNRINKGQNFIIGLDT